MCFVKMVKDKKISDFDLRKNFDDLVERSDYQGTPKEQIIDWLKREILFNDKVSKNNKEI